MLDIIAPAAVACLAMTAILCAFGIHVIMREVIFVDLALAQIAALGAAVAAWMGYDPHSPAAYACAVAFTLAGAGVFSVGRFRDGRVPQEAIIGIVYAVSTALALLILARIAIERDEIDHLLVGRLLFVSWPEIGVAVLLFAVVGAVHVIMRGRFLAASRRPSATDAAGWPARLIDFAFYATLGLVVTISVQMAGVLPVFSFLVVPAACGMTFFARVRHRLVAGWIVGVAGSGLGLAASVRWDLPTGECLVAALGGLFALIAALHAIRTSRSSRAPSADGAAR
jgi:zinc/manganese transport system permease protein